VSHLVCKCHILTTSVASVTNIILPSCLCRASNDIIRTLKTPQRLVLKKRNQLTRSTSLLPLEKPLKNGFWRANAPLPTVRECQHSLGLFGGAFKCSVYPFGGALPFLSGFLVCWAKTGKNPLNLWRWLDSNRRSRHDLREDPQLKERNPQLIPNISQVVGPLQGYIRRPSHGERYRMEKLRLHQTYDLISEMLSKHNQCRLLEQRGWTRRDGRGCCTSIKGL
jgi:hypothetical protein